MSKLITLISLILLANSFLSQENEWRGPCADGTEESSTNYGIPKYYVDKFKKKYNVHLKIENIMVGEESVDVKLDYNGKIKYETEILELTDSIAVKLLLARSEINSNKELLYKLMILRNQDGCWRSLSVFYFYPMWSNKMTLGGTSVGTPGTDGYVQIGRGAMDVE